MKKKVIVLSLGGSLIIPDNIDTKFLKDLKNTVKKNTKKYKFVIICGGGSIARKYIHALRSIGINDKIQNLAGISATRMNARFVNYLFGINPEKGIPHSIRDIEKKLNEKDIVICGALKYKPHQTSDSTSAEIAEHFKSIFINLTNVQGLHDKNPKEFRNAKLIPKITWKDFDMMVNKINFKPGQNFVLDQSASRIIRRSKTPTYILGKDIKQLDNLLKNKKFKGTSISG